MLKSLPRFKISWVLLLALILRLLLASYFWADPTFALQQDNYANFASSLLERGLNSPSFPRLDTRLFPGYPLVIAVLTPIFGSTTAAGLVISLSASLIAIYLFYRLSHSLPLAFTFGLFPPVWLRQGIKIATEPLAAALFLLSIFLYFKKRPLLSGLILGYALSVRLITLPLFVSLVVFSLLRPEFRRQLASFVLGFLLLMPITPVFNHLFYGEFNLDRQILINSEYGRSAFGLLMIFQDFIRTLDWHQYRIFTSGLFYFLLILSGQLGLYLHRKKSALHQLFNLWSFFSILFIFSIASTPLIQDLGRYAVVFAPTSILGVYEGIRSCTRQKRSR